jgi:hypothetical protein
MNLTQGLNLTKGKIEKLYNLNKQTRKKYNNKIINNKIINKKKYISFKSKKYNDNLHNKTLRINFFKGTANI